MVKNLDVIIKHKKQINEILVKLAKEGHTVGRIKGGDPYVFGRGGEEVLSLVEENIEFEVIPGVTSPICSIKLCRYSNNTKRNGTKFSYCNWNVRRRFKNKLGSFS